jgi:hypothetical protein
LVWSIVSPKRRRRLIADASRSRRSAAQRAAAIGAVAVYNFVGLLDIFSTMIGLSAGGVEEANPFLRVAMASFGPGWIGAKLFLQAVITVMVLWFPHRIVLAIFIIAVICNAGVVYNNLHVAGVF